MRTFGKYFYCPRVTMTDKGYTVTFLTQVLSVKGMKALDVTATDTGKNNIVSCSFKVKKKDIKDAEKEIDKYFQELELRLFNKVANEEKLVEYIQFTYFE